MTSATDTLLRETTSLCGSCKSSIPAQLWRARGQVVMRKTCPAHGPSEVLISPDADWYAAMMSHGADLVAPDDARPVERGCPFDCGPCTAHQQTSQLPIVPITSACNLDCPICYTHNKNDGAYHMSADELRAILEHMRATDPGRRIINITGGEPTQHPQLLPLLEMCRDEGIHRITLSTHGLRFVKEEPLLARLAELDVRVILSFDSFEDETNVEMLGGRFTSGKLRVLELLEKHRVSTTLLPVLARGKNDHEIGALIDLALSRDFIRSLELHTMTFTGQSGADFDPAARYTTLDVLRDIEAQTDGALRVTDFVPSPAAHPMCYLVTYLLRLPSGRWLPFSRFMEPADLRALLAGMLYLEPSAEMERRLGDVINRLWAGEIECEDADEVLAALKGIIETVFAPGLDDLERMRRAETCSKAVYIHSHMDEESFDTDRIQQCCVGIREPDGSNIPSCAYNILYRERDARFAVEPSPPLVTLGRGRVGDAR